MTTYSKKFNKFTGNFDLIVDDATFHVKDPVDTYNDLPITGNSENDVRFTKDTDDAYVWTIASASGSLSDWERMPLLSNIDLDDIADGTTYKRITATDQAKIHSANGDTDLDSTFEATFVKKADTINVLSDITSPGADIEDAVTKKHSQNSDTDLDATFEATFVKKADTVNVLSDITSPGVNIEDAVTKRHTHSNQTELDLITDGDHDVRTDNPHSVTKTQVGLSNVPNLDTTDAVNNEHIQDTDTILLSGGSGDEKLIDTGTLKSNLSVDNLITIDGRDLSVDGSKLDGIEASAVALATVKADSDIADAITKKHTQNADTDLDATFEATFVKKVDTVNVLSDISSAGADIEDAVTKRHSANGDTDLDSTFEATFVKKVDTVNVLSDITSAGADIEDAVTKKHVAVTVAGAPLTLSTQQVTFNYDTNDFQLDGNNLQVKDSGISHNSLADLQGGQSDQYYHLNSSEYDELTKWLDSITLESGGGITMADDLDLGGNDILDVGNIAVDSISSAGGTSITVTLGGDSGDDLIVGSNFLVVEGDTGKIGIGTATPAYNVEIEAANPEIELEGTNVNSACIVHLNNTSRSWSVGMYDQSPNSIFRIRDDSASKERLAIDEIGRILSDVKSDTDSDTDDVLSTGITSGYGLLIVRESVDGVTGLFRIENQTIVDVSSNAAFTITKDNAGTYNVYWDTDQFKVQNKVGDNKNIKVGFYGV